MRESLKEYCPTVFKYWWVVVMGGAIAAIGAIISIQRGLIVPIWVWVAVGIIGLFIAQFLAFHKIRIERDTLKAQLGDKAKWKQIRETLGHFIDEGQQIKERCHKANEEPPKKEAEDWVTKVEHYLIVNLGSDYANTFFSSDGLPIGITTLSGMHMRVESYMSKRLARLNQFLAEIRQYSER